MDVPYVWDHISNGRAKSEDCSIFHRVTLDLGTPYLMLWSFFPLYYMLIDSCSSRALKIKETGLLFYACKQRCLPATFS